MNLVAVFPIVLLIYLMTRRKSVSSHIALPIVAVIAYLIKLFYFDSDFTLLSATVIDGLLTAWTPILVIWGAIFLFRTMENTGGMDIVRKWLDSISSNKVAQLMIIGWAFSFLIEGASGFGTPAALAAPLLVGLGFQPLKVAILTLIMNSVPVTFGAVGTPIWFGLGQLGLSDPQLLEIGAKSALMHSVAALIIPLIALRFIVSRKEIFKNIIFIYLSILSCIIPYYLLAQSSYEFPSIVGGFIGLILTVIFAKYNVGLQYSKKVREEKQPLFKIVKATFPLWGTVLLLVITRLKELPLKAWLNSHFLITYNDILGTGINFKHALLYVPSLIPFFLISLIAFWIFGSKKTVIKKAWLESWNRMKKPIIALLGALVFVKLFMVDGEMSMAMIIGKCLSEAIGTNWQLFASFLGGLGSFFSGSNTVSNLTFGGIQESIATTLNLDLTNILAAQSVGGAMGNMICINNIVAVSSVLGLANVEGKILRSTFCVMLSYGFIAGIVTFFLN
jgi:lactate permease